MIDYFWALCEIFGWNSSTSNQLEFFGAINLVTCEDGEITTIVSRVFFRKTIDAILYANYFDFSENSWCKQVIEEFLVDSQE